MEDINGDGIRQCSETDQRQAGRMAEVNKGSSQAVNVLVTVEEGRHQLSIVVVVRL